MRMIKRKKYFSGIYDFKGDRTLKEFRDFISNKIKLYGLDALVDLDYGREHDKVIFHFEEETKEEKEIRLIRATKRRKKRLKRLISEKNEALKEIKRLDKKIKYLT